jgi:hypothetical protein
VETAILKVGHKARRDKKLASKIKELAASKEKGEKLRKAMVEAATKRYTAQSKELQDATQLF